MWNEVTTRHSDPDRRFIRGVHEEGSHDKMLSNVLMRSTAEDPKIRNINSNINLCSEIREENRKKFLEEKRRQQLRANNQELKELERQLRAAYAKKILDAQIFEQASLKNEKIAEAQRCDLELEKAKLSQIEAAKKLEEEKKAKKAALKSDLQEQIAISSASRMKKYELVLKEKQLMEETTRKCKEEEQLLLLEAEQRKLQARAELEAFKRSQEEWKISQNMATEEEDEKIKDVLKEREIQLQKAKEEKMQEMMRKEQISEKIGKEIHAIAEQKAAKRDLLAELLVDERQAKEEIRLRTELEQQKRERDAIRYQMAVDREEKERRKAAQRKIDEEYFKEQMRILAEQDRLELLSDEKRRRKQMEHRRLLQEDLDEKKRSRAECTKNLLRDRDQQIMDEKKMQQMVEEERIRMLQEHASGILGYLPPGVIRDSDRKYFPIPPKQN